VIKLSYRDLLSDDPTKVAEALDKAIPEDKTSEVKKKARIGEKYYKFEHDILDNRIFYIDDNGQLQEDKYASNVKIPHPFFTEQVDQKVQYVLSEPIELIVPDDKEHEGLQDKLDDYYDENMQVFLQEALEGASKKGLEYVYARTNADDRLSFQVSDSLKTFEVYDENGERQRTVRYYNKDIEKDDELKSIEHAEVWDDEQVYYFVKEENKYTLDTSREMNPRKHVLAVDSQGTVLGRSYERNPFYRLSNNTHETTDLEPIKALIDDYDLMAAFLSNNLQDFSEAIYVVKGFKGDDLTSLRQNVKSKKTVGVGTDGDLDIRTVEIPHEARKTKLEIDKDAIYKFGMAVDTSQIGHSSGTVTNVAIKAGYSLLDMKANKAEVRLRSMLKWMNEMIIDDINRRHNTNYMADNIEITITRTTPVNENDIATNEKIQAETQQLYIQTIIAAAPRIGDEETLKLICEQFELDWEEVQDKLEKQEYTSGLQDDTDPPEMGDEVDGEIEATE
jgi:SPP1 family phage portal protein